MLILVFIPGIGVEVNGSNRWIRVFGFSLQPSEIMKFLSILYISTYCVRRIEFVQNDLFSFIRPAVLLVSIISLILMQPDLGASAVIFASALGVLFVAGVPIRQFIVVFLIGLIGIVLLITYVPWRWERIISFVDPWSDPFDKGYQLTLSLMSIGRGDWFGVGLELWEQRGSSPNDTATGRITSYLLNQANTAHDIWGMGFQVRDNDTWRTPLTIHNSGNIGIGVDNPSNKLEVDGAIVASGDITGFGSVSDIKLKKNIETLEGSLARVMKMKPVKFQWKNNVNHIKAGTKDEGFIAQDMEKVIPLLVDEVRSANAWGPDESYKKINYHKITTYLVGAVQEQQKMIEEQKNIIEQQQEMINNQQKMMEEFRRELDILKQNI